MSPEKTSGRQLKHRVLELLQQENPDKCISELYRLPARKVVNPLFSYLCSPNELVKWRAVSAMGAVLANLAEANLESARVVMRRFIWQLNDESGGIGWGCPEAMGDTMARSRRLAKEYAGILVSYMRPEGNFLEHEMLQRGVLWGVGRLAHRRPHLFTGCAPLLIPYMQSRDAALRGLAVWATVPMAAESTLPFLRQLSKDSSRFSFYYGWHISEKVVGQIANDAIKAAENSG